jgi:pimeloyl-ACP methyl ester carboxylesterase
MLLTAAIALGLAACGGGTSTSSPAPPAEPNPTGSTSTQRGTLVSASLTAALSTSQFTANLNSIDNGSLVLEWGGPLSCAINIYRVEYWTVAPTPPGGTASPTLVSGALMIPAGPGAQCSGTRPMVLFAHGLGAPDPTYAMTDVSDLTKGVQPAAIFAAQGYIVVAPNFPGYDGSTLGYYPLLNADQNAKDMMDALTAATAALSGVVSSTITYNGKLFVTGGSLGGFVAMATDKAMQAAGLTVVATAPTSGLYALEANFDSAFLGGGLRSTELELTFLTTSYQNAYGNVYSALTDVYSPQSAPYITSELPEQTQGLLPAAVFNSTPPPTGNVQLDALLQPPANPAWTPSFGNPYLITDGYRQSYVTDVVAHPDGAAPAPLPGVPLAAAPQNTLRQDLQTNDMRSWTPRMPMLLCGGHQDPNVTFGLNTQTMAAYWSGEVASGLLTILDVDSTPAPGDPYAAVQTTFQQFEAQVIAASGATEALDNYHGVSGWFCMIAARQFFAQF